MRTKLDLETLETRLTPAGTITLVGGLLSVTGDNGDNAVDIRTQGDGTVNVRIDAVQQTFAVSSIQSTVVRTLNGNDDVFTNLSVGTLVDLGAGSDAANILHGAGAQVFGGPGRDRLYAIIGGPNFLDGGPGMDQNYTNAQGVITADPADETSVIFGQATQPGFTLINNVLYYVPGAGDNTVLLQQVGNQVLAIAQLNGKPFATQVLDRGALTDFATVLGSGNDTLIADVDGLDLTAYGAGGNDTLIASPRIRDAFFKGGAGNDTLIAASDTSDITGDGGADVLFGNVIRTDGLDTVFLTRKGRLINAA